MKSAAAWMLVSTFGLGGLLFACDSVYADPITAPFTSFGGIPDSGLTSSRLVPVPCPERPQENGPCVQPGTVCEVGTSPDKRCNTIFTCASDTAFGGYWTEQGAPSCKTTCPDPSQIVDGAPCDVGDAGGDEAELHCTTESATCICTTGRDGAHAHPRKWVCKQPEIGCPLARPMLGKACSGGWSCDYGSCESKRGMRMICEDDVWQTEIAECE